MHDGAGGFLHDSWGFDAEASVRSPCGAERETVLGLNRLPLSQCCLRHLIEPDPSNSCASSWSHGRTPAAFRSSLVGGATPAGPPVRVPVLNRVPGEPEGGLPAAKPGHECQGDLRLGPCKLYGWPQTARSTVAEEPFSRQVHRSSCFGHCTST